MYRTQKKKKKSKLLWVRVALALDLPGDGVVCWAGWLLVSILALPTPIWICLQSMTFLLMLLLIFFYIFAVTGVYFFQDYSRSTIENLEYNMFFS